MYVQGVSRRKVTAVTEALCGHGFSASSISAINKLLDERLKAFAERRPSGLAGVEFVVSDDHPGLKRAIREVLPEAAWQRCCVRSLNINVYSRIKCGVWSRSRVGTAGIA